MEERIAEPLLAREDSPEEKVQVVLPGEADPSENLQRALDDRARGARHVRLGDRRRLCRVRRFLVERGRGVEDRRPCRLAQHVCVGEDVLDRLVRADRASELLALSRVVDRKIERADAAPTASAAVATAPTANARSIDPPRGRRQQSSRGRRRRRREPGESRCRSDRRRVRARSDARASAETRTKPDSPSSDATTPYPETALPCRFTPNFVPET